MKISDTPSKLTVNIERGSLFSTEEILGTMLAVVKAVARGADVTVTLVDKKVDHGSKNPQTLEGSVIGRVD